MPDSQEKFFSLQLPIMQIYQDLPRDNPVPKEAAAQFVDTIAPAFFIWLMSQNADQIVKKAAEKPYFLYDFQLNSDPASIILSFRSRNQPRIEEMHVTGSKTNFVHLMFSRSHVNPVMPAGFDVSSITPTSVKPFQYKTVRRTINLTDDPDKRKENTWRETKVDQRFFITNKKYEPIHFRTFASSIKGFFTFFGEYLN